MSLGNVARVVAVLAACLAAAASATSSNQSPPPQTTASASPQQQPENQPPPPRQMEASAALGLWRSTFGAVKIEGDNSKGGIEAGAVQGIWIYQRGGQEVIGYFAGSLRGNVLDFRWQEPNNPPLTGAGFLVFEPQGRQYSGRWWSDRGDRVGHWNGWRQGGSQEQPISSQYGQPAYGNQPPAPYGGATYGGNAYGGPTPPPYNPGYGQPGPYQPQPYNPNYAQPPQQPPPPPRPRGYY